MAVSEVVADSVVVAGALTGDPMAMTLDDLVKQLQAVYGEDLVTAVLYGSAAAGEHIPKRSDYNVLVIVRDLGMSRLDAAAAMARAWSETGSPAPMTLTEAEWRSSADIFPMEYADILERHKVLAGSPPFDGITVDPQYLRLQVEHEAMGKLIQLRQGILMSGGDAKRLVELLPRTLSTFMVIFRSVMRLHSVVPSTDNQQLSRDVAAKAGFDAEPFIAVVRHVRGEQKLASGDVRRVITGYLEGATRLVRHLDAAHKTD